MFFEIGSKIGSKLLKTCIALESKNPCNVVATGVSSWWEVRGSNPRPSACKADGKDSLDADIDRKRPRYGIPMFPSPCIRHVFADLLGPNWVQKDSP